MNILFTVCGRAGSKGFKNKNLKNFFDRPLIFYTIAAIKLYKDVHTEHDISVALNTDSQDLIRIAKSQNVLDFFTIVRDESLGGDTVPKVVVIKDCLEKSTFHFKKVFDVVVDLDNTSPLRTVKDIENAISKYSDNVPNYDVVYSVTGARRNPYFNLVEEHDGYFSTSSTTVYTTRQAAPQVYDMNASIYAYSPHALKVKNSSSFFKSNCSAIVMKDTAVLDIDSEDDFELMQVVAKWFYEKDESFREIYEAVKKM